MANDSKCYLGYLNMLVNEYNNTNYRSIGKSLFILIVVF